MTTPDATAPYGGEDAPSVRDRLLGAFVVFQLLAIPAGSLIKFVPVRIPEWHGELMGELQQPLPVERWASASLLQPAFDALAYGSTRWAEVSGQQQSWALFACFQHQAAMPAVELRWPGRDPVTIRITAEPDDPTAYFQLPPANCRLFNYEYRMCIFYWVRSLEEVAARPDLHGPEAVTCVRDMHRSIQAYLRWRTLKYLGQHPQEAWPDEVVLKARIFRTPAPGVPQSQRVPVEEVPVARWRPDAPVSTDQLSIEAWDPVAKAFVPLSPREAS